RVLASPAVNLTKAINPVVRNLSQHPTGVSTRFADAVLRQKTGDDGKSLVRALASIEALGELVDNLPKPFQKVSDATTFSHSYHIPSIEAKAFWLQNLSIHQSEKATLAESAEVENLLRLLEPLLKGISKLSPNEWKNLAEDVRRQPNFRSGEPRP